MTPRESMRTGELRSVTAARSTKYAAKRVVAVSA
jgi:hypothetical protein